MLRLDAVHLHALPRHRLPPVQFVRLGKSEPSQTPGDAKRAKNHRPMIPRQSAQGWAVEMVVMVVADQERIDRRQILEADATRGFGSAASHG
jgi:hypothetical protein